MRGALSGSRTNRRKRGTKHEHHDPVRHQHIFAITVIYSIFADMEKRLQRDRKRQPCGESERKIHGMGDILPDMGASAFTIKRGGYKNEERTGMHDLSDRPPRRMSCVQRDRITA